MNPPSTVLGGGVHGKVCWLIAYIQRTIVIHYVTINIGHSNVIPNSFTIVYAYVELGAFKMSCLYNVFFITSKSMKKGQ